MIPHPSRIRATHLSSAGRRLHQEHARRTSGTAHNQHPRAGFTLLEVLLATGLTATLLVAISAALGLFSRYVTAGRDRVTQSQIQRALGERLRHDIQRVVSPLRLSSSTNGDDRSDPASLTDSQATGSSTETHRIRRHPSDETYVTALRGNESRLAITVHRSGRKTPGGADPASNAERSAVNPAPFTEQVVWQLGADGAGAIVPGSARGLSRYSSVASASTRHTSDTTLSADQENGETPVYLTEVIPEVASLRLRYFDGKGWQSHWNSSLTDSLPRAIEVVVQLDTDPHDHRTTLSSERYVFPLPRDVPHAEQSSASDRRGSGRMRRTDGPRFSSFSLEETR